uniref:MPN domain-containing protein n=1 Tax=Rhabditophanes sp. KR3021 TaxID=114890 RepID=A0AC35U3I7_9BILA
MAADFLKLFLEQHQLNDVNEPKLPLDKQFYPDASEIVYISPLATMKMVKYANDLIPMEVMGLLLGEFVDDYTIKVVDVFAMPQKSSTATVECIDPLYQVKMVELLKKSGRPEEIVGWYHSHVGIGCVLSRIDLKTQKTFEAMNPRSIAVVFDPVSSVKGSLSLGCYRSRDYGRDTFDTSGIDFSAFERRQITSNLGVMTKGESCSLRTTILSHIVSTLHVEYPLTNDETTMLMHCTNREKSKWEILPSSTIQKKNINNIKKLISISDILIENQKDIIFKTTCQKELEKYGQSDSNYEILNVAKELMTDNFQCALLNSLSLKLNVNKKQE